MCPAHDTITPKNIDRYAAGVLQPHLQWYNRGPKCTVTTLLQVMFYAAAQLCSMFAACSRLRDAPSDQAVRNALSGVVSVSRDGGAATQRQLRRATAPGG